MDRRKFLKSAPALGASLAVPLSAFGALQVNSRGGVLAAAGRSIRAETSPQQRYGNPGEH